MTVDFSPRATTHKKNPVTKRCLIAPRSALFAEIENNYAIQRPRPLKDKVSQSVAYDLTLKAWHDLQDAVEALTIAGLYEIWGDDEINAVKALSTIEPYYFTGSVLIPKTVVDAPESTVIDWEGIPCAEWFIARKGDYDYTQRIAVAPGSSLVVFFLCRYPITDPADGMWPAIKTYDNSHSSVMTTQKSTLNTPLLQLSLRDIFDLVELEDTEFWISKASTTQIPLHDTRVGYQ